MDLAKWLVEKRTYGFTEFLPEGFDFSFLSKSNCKRKNFTVIYLGQYLEFKTKEQKNKQSEDVIKSPYWGFPIIRFYSKQY